MAKLTPKISTKLASIKEIAYIQSYMTDSERGMTPYNTKCAELLCKKSEGDTILSLLIKKGTDYKKSIPKSILQYYGPESNSQSALRIVFNNMLHELCENTRCKECTSNAHDEQIQQIFKKLTHIVDE